eukprot:3820095-Amphidinium_carterae.1
MLMSMRLPGETLLIPSGWWWYAAALAPSVVVMHTFYKCHAMRERHSIPCLEMKTGWQRALLHIILDCIMCRVRFLRASLEQDAYMCIALLFLLSMCQSIECCAHCGGLPGLQPPSDT